MGNDAVTFLALVICRASIGVPDVPIAPLNVMSDPPELMVRFCAPWIVLPNEMSAPVNTSESKVVAPLKVIGPANAIVESCVMTLPPIDTDPAPACCKAPERLKLAPAATVKAPELSNTRGPPLAVVIEPAKLITGVAMLMPPKAVEVMPEPMVVVPVPLVTSKEPTFITLFT